MRLAAAGFAVMFSGCAVGSALYETTPACDLLSEAEASAIAGETMVKQGGASDPGLSDCLWQGPAVSIQFSLTDASLYAPSGQTASDEFDRMVETTTKAGHPPELISGVGERAALHRSDDGTAFFLTVVAKGDYLSITLTASTRDALIALGQTAAARMGSP